MTAEPPFLSVNVSLRPVHQDATMMRKDVNKPKGKTSAYAFFVQTCREEHRKKNPEQSVNFAEFSKKCSERWKVRRRGHQWTDRVETSRQTDRHG